MKTGFTAYAGALGLLLLLTGLTVVVARIDLGAFNIVAAIAIAAFKASIVTWVFMHLDRAGAQVRLTAVVASSWLVLLLAVTYLDYGSRPRHAHPAHPPPGAPLDGGASTATEPLRSR